MKKYKRMTEEDQKSIVRFIHELSAAEDESLSWKLLESTFGFTRQAMQAKPGVKSAFQHAKSSIRNGDKAPRRIRSMSHEDLVKKVEELEGEIKLLKEREHKWKQRWQRIAYNIRQKGLQVNDVDAEAAQDGKLPNSNETESIIRTLDSEIPPPLT
ncbi:protein kinase [Billgrantia kenyensis]|uniref:Protein kinase n=1 Tax=Billgrantia kenyensis TaxID=321266 RepID=A0A7W0AG88_9GAMM|nr:protein kinase [Halomonas kenyensis]MBA2781151.1 protein kinase [Halomonas kenyensis]MCG6663841.1 protein kinase [Halomonas kenyensis]